jgi:hypothetical protein
VDNPPEKIIFKSLEVLAKITVPVNGEFPGGSPVPDSMPEIPGAAVVDNRNVMDEDSVKFALEILDKSRRQLQSRDREVFSALIQLYACNLHLIGDLSRVIAYMCRLQPPAFIFVSFAVELDNFIQRETQMGDKRDTARLPMSRNFQFVGAFIQQMCLVLLNSREAKELRNVLKDCIGYGNKTEQRDQRRSRLFHILLHSFSHNLVAATSLCLWGGACRTASLFLKKIDPLDINLVFLLELDKLVEMIERPLFRHLHVRMLDADHNPLVEGSGTMLFQTLKCILMLIPQSACYNVLRDRLVSTSRFRQSVIANRSHDDEENLSPETQMFVSRVLEVRRMHCQAIWETIRTESLEAVALKAGRVHETKHEENEIVLPHEEGSNRREWLGYSSKEEEMAGKARYQTEKQQIQGSSLTIEEFHGSYNELTSMPSQQVKVFIPNPEGYTTASSRDSPIVEATSDTVESKDPGNEAWKDYWSTGKD